MYRHRSLTVLILSVAGTIAGCGPGQLMGPTLTPTSTKTPIPTATSTQAPTSTPTVVPTPIGGVSRIAFSSSRDGNWEIYLMDSDGHNQRRLTNAPTASDWFPKFSPDGQLLLYWSYTEKPVSAKLHWLRANGSSGDFADGVAAYTSFSPDGNSVALTEFTGGGNVDIFTIPTVGGDVARLTKNAAVDYEPAWSPDGKTIAFVSERDGGTPHIYLMNVDGSNQHRLDGDARIELEPAYSPDGTQIAFLSELGNLTSNIYIADATGKNAKDLTRVSSGLNENPAWSPDGKMIAFWSDRTGSHQIFAIKTDGSGLVQLTDTEGNNENPSWSK
jgi:tol-pal system beta propeller repeat protein TolB